MDHYQNSSACIAVVLAHFNGSSWLERQLQSIQNQTHKFIDVYIFDDCSSETEVNRCKKIASKYPVVKKIFQARLNQGFARNFISGLQFVGDGYDYYAFSDQDDYWLPDKVSAAVRQLDAISQQSKLYCSRTFYFCDETRVVTGSSPLFTKNPTFGNALVQNIAGGNTMVFDGFLRSQLLKMDKVSDCISHDWMVYQLASGSGSTVIYDPQPKIHYCQTGQNLVGANNTLWSRSVRAIGLMNGKFRRWNDCQTNILYLNKNLLSVENVSLLERFIEARTSNIISRCRFIFSKSVYRQTFLGNLGLILGFLVRHI